MPIQRWHLSHEGRRSNVFLAFYFSSVVLVFLPVGWDGILVEVFVNSFIDDLTNIGDVEICMECVVWYKPGNICYGSEDFLLWSLYNCCNGFAGASPQFYSVCPYGFDHCFVN